MDMAYYKEIVTKAVIGKGKKTKSEEYVIETNEKIDNVLGCWVINHNFRGNVSNNTIVVSGNFDVNIWYSYNNNSKTNVMIKKFSYEYPMNVNIKENASLTKDSEIIVRTLEQPSVVDVSIENNNIHLTIEKQMGVEVIGDTTVRVSVEDTFDDYEEIEEDTMEEMDVTDDYLK
jgi:spore coat protein E